MNLKGLRDINFTDLAINARASIGEARHADQAIFNYICRGRSFILPRGINHMTTIGSSWPLCNGELELNLHYIGSPKPWLGPSKTSNWLAHKLWHQACKALFPSMAQPEQNTTPHDFQTIRRKALIYSLINRSRFFHYRCDIRSLQDPGRVLLKAQSYWNSLKCS